MARTIELLPGESVTLADGTVVKAIEGSNHWAADHTVSQAIERVVQVVGSKTVLAEALGVKTANISQWIKGSRRISPRRCEQIEQLSLGAINRRDLRPDDWRRYWAATAKA